MTTNAQTAQPHGALAGTPLGEMWRVAEENPDFSLMRVIDAIDRTLWDIEQPTADQRVVYARLNGRIALRRLRDAIDGLQATYPLDAPARRRQWLATGAHVRVPALLSAHEIAALVGHCDRFLAEPGTRPLRIFDETALLDERRLAALGAAALAALPEPLPKGARPALLKRRTLLRRTFPPARLPRTMGNANNQYWHQDSNPKFNDAPMLTLWIPLQDGAGVTSPGIEVIDAPVSYFSVLHGDSSQEIHGILVQMFPGTQVTALAAGAGDCVLFNGLTFHQTSTRPAMTAHRDALLIRIIEAADAEHFGPDGAADGILPLV